MFDDASRLEVTCPSCGKLYRVKRELAGKAAKCGCGAKLAIPTAATPAAPSQKLTTELVLPPDAAKLEISDDDYEIETPVERPVSEAIRRTLAPTNPNDLPPHSWRLRPPPPPASGDPSGWSLGPSAAALIFRISITLVLLSVAISLWMSFRVINSAYAILASAQFGSGQFFFDRISSQRAELDHELAAFNVANLLEFSMSMFAFIVYLVWVYAAHSRLKALGASNLRFTPGWAVGYHFVPFWNLIRPYQIMREIWHGSDPLGAPVNNCSRLQVMSWWAIRTWWTVALSGSATGIYLFLRGVDEMRALPLRPSVSQFVDVTIHGVWRQQASLLFVIVYYILMLFLVRSIERRQTTPRGAAN